MEVSAGRFTARLAETDDDVRAAQRLRYRVFVEEMGASASPQEHETRQEIDRFDDHCDHLILFDNESTVEDPLDRVIGVYRLLRGSVAKAGPGFYSAAEYDLTRILEYPHETLELGRSCVHAEYRSGSAMQLLWMALAQYIYEHKLRLLFGCASFSGTDMTALAKPLSYLHHNKLAPEHIRPRVLDEFYNDMNLLPEGDVDRPTAMREMPALIKGYLRLNGYVGDGAFIDREFNTVDVCLVMETDKISARYHSFYAGKSEAEMQSELGGSA